MGALTDSVGQNGANLSQDVARVQMFLKTAGCDPGRVDGVCGSETIAAIRKFQESFMTAPDGRIEPEGFTWKKLAQAQQQAVSEETKG